MELVVPARLCEFVVLSAIDGAITLMSNNFGCTALRCSFHCLDAF
jgi:hypothetical protein